MTGKESDKRTENCVETFFTGYETAVSLVVPDNF
jgi:hypothetical protein